MNLLSPTVTNRNWPYINLANWTKTRFGIFVKHSRISYSSNSLNGRFKPYLLVRHPSPQPPGSRYSWILSLISWILNHKSWIDLIVFIYYPRSNIYRSLYPFSLSFMYFRISWILNHKSWIISPVSNYQCLHLSTIFHLSSTIFDLWFFAYCFRIINHKSWIMPHESWIIFPISCFNLLFTLSTSSICPNSQLVHTVSYSNTNI